MSVTVPEAVVNSEVRSIGKLIYEVFGGGEPILLERRQDVARPHWRIQAPGPLSFAREASGWDNGNRSYIAGYYGTGRLAVMEKVDVLRNYLRGAIPMFVFDGRWLNPRIEMLDADPSGPNLPAGAYSVSCSFLSMHDDESLPSKAFGVTLVAPGRLRVYAPAWPFQAPLFGRARFYIGPSSGPRQIAGEVPFGPYGWPSAVISAVPAPGAAAEPTQSRMYLGPLRVNQVNISTFEVPDTDGDFDAVFSLSCSRELHLDLWSRNGWRPYQEGEVIVSPAEATSLFSQFSA